MTTLCGLVEARHEPVPRNDGAWGRGGLAAVKPVGAGQEVEQRGPIQVARMVHNTYWVPEGRGGDAIAGTLRSGVDATASGPSSSQKHTGVSPPLLHRGGREGFDTRGGERGEGWNRNNGGCEQKRGRFPASVTGDLSGLQERAAVR